MASALVAGATAAVSEQVARLDVLHLIPNAPYIIILFSSLVVIVNI